VEQTASKFLHTTTTTGQISPRLKKRKLKKLLKLQKKLLTNLRKPQMKKNPE